MTGYITLLIMVILSGGWAFSYGSHLHFDYAGKICQKQNSSLLSTVINLGEKERGRLRKKVGRGR